MQSSTQIILEGLVGSLQNFGESPRMGVVGIDVNTHRQWWRRFNWGDDNGCACVSGSITGRITSIISCRYVHSLDLWFF